MATVIRIVEEQRHTIYRDDGTIEVEVYSARYRCEDVADPDLGKWVEVSTPNRDDTRTVTAQRDRIEADARSDEGLAPRA